MKNPEMDPDGKPWPESQWKILPVPKPGETCQCGGSGTTVYFDGSKWDYTANRGDCPAREFIVAQHPNKR